MLKGLLLVLTFSIANAATIATVSCNHNITSDPTQASCSDATSSASAEALVGALNSLFVTQVQAGGPGGASQAKAMISGTYLLTVTAQRGDGFFLPCLTASASSPDVMVDASFGPYSYFGPYNSSGNYTGCTNVGAAIPFDAVSRPFLVDISASARQSSFQPPQLGYAVLQSFNFWDRRGFPQSATYTLAFVSDQFLPEANTFTFVVGTLLVFSIMHRRQRQPSPGK